MNFKCGKLVNYSKLEGENMPRHATKTSFKSGANHVFWGGGCYNYWHREARKMINCPKGMIVHHINGDFTDNNKSNLKVMTQREHVILHNKERTGIIKLNSKIRNVIRGVLKLNKDGLSRKQISDVLNVNCRMVKRCLSTKWRCQYE